MHFKIELFGRVHWIDPFSFNFANSEMPPRSPKRLPNYDPARRERKQSGRQSQNVIYVLTEFALELMRVLEAFNAENFQSDGKLRIGKYFSLRNSAFLNCYFPAVKSNHTNTAKSDWFMNVYKTQQFSIQASHMAKLWQVLLDHRNHCMMCGAIVWIWPHVWKVRALPAKFKWPKNRPRNYSRSVYDAIIEVKRMWKAVVIYRHILLESLKVWNS